MQPAAPPFGWAAEEADYAREQVAKLRVLIPKRSSSHQELPRQTWPSKAYTDVCQQGKSHHHCRQPNTKPYLILVSISRNWAAKPIFPVDKDGLIDLKELEAAIKPTTILIAIMYANNEIGNDPAHQRSLLQGNTACWYLRMAPRAVNKIPVDVNKDRYLSTCGILCSTKCTVLKVWVLYTFGVKIKSKSNSPDGWRWPMNAACAAVHSMFRELLSRVKAMNSACLTWKPTQSVFQSSAINWNHLCFTGRSPCERKPWFTGYPCI